MVLEEKKIKKICNFYVSDYHLEIMLLPYISKKLENKESIVIITEKNLEDTIKIVIDRINLEQNKKQKIINLGWNNSKIDNIIDNITENSNIILVGNTNFINAKILELNENQVINLKIISCYDFNEVKDNIQDIVNEYDGILNTQGISNY